MPPQWSGQELAKIMAHHLQSWISLTGNCSAVLLEAVFLKLEHELKAFLDICMGCATAGTAASAPGHDPDGRAL